MHGDAIKDGVCVYKWADNSVWCRVNDGAWCVVWINALLCGVSVLRCFVIIEK